jgi:hypothetical protein
VAIDQDVPEHSRPPQIGKTFGAKAVELYLATPPLVVPVIPVAADLRK